MEVKIDMFDGRHCTQEDLTLLMNETKKVKNAVFQQNMAYLPSFLRFVARFDEDISNRLRLSIDSSSGDVKKIISLIDQYNETLIQNVIVDINEHRE